jgi:hypothetical protein
MCLIYYCIAEEITEQWQLISVAKGLLSNFLVTQAVLLLCMRKFQNQISTWRPTIPTEGSLVFLNPSSRDSISN